MADSVFLIVEKFPSILASEKLENYLNQAQRLKDGCSLSNQIKY
jgi:hypothetical protein